MKKKVLTSLLLSSACLMTMGTAALVAGADYKVPSPTYSTVEPAGDAKVGYGEMVVKGTGLFGRDKTVKLTTAPTIKSVSDVKDNAESSLWNSYVELSSLVASTATTSSDWAKYDVTVPENSKVSVTHMFDVDLGTSQSFKNVTLNFKLSPDESWNSACSYQVISLNEKTGKWDKARGVKYDAATGNATATFDHLCPVAFVKVEDTNPIVSLVTSWKFVAMTMVVIGVIVLIVLLP